VTLSIVYLFTRRRGVRFDGTRFFSCDSSLGGLWLRYNLSIASAIGFIALAGVSAEFGVIMLIYLDHAWLSGGPRINSPPNAI
jgi:hypothetical protein